MICPVNAPYEGKCRKEATVSVPTGYGADDMLCETHARQWGEGHRREFERLRSFYERLGQQSLFEEAS